MYLKSLEIKGFKSFAQRVNLHFEKGITGVVGPNGCGKSNVTEAIRWVLGEQSARNLRGQKMEDVIFSGTDKRKPHGMAEVSIVFDNMSQQLPLKFDEVCLTRRVYRSGEGEYFINGSPCRRKDLKEILMDTGIGKEGYSMISQGRIDEILSQKGEERRLLLDEAAGIVKYRTRKEEAEKKIEKTEENLLRIKDILTELDQHMGPLSEQSAKAEMYLNLKEKVDFLEISELLKNIKNQKQGIQQKEENLKTTEEEIDRLLEEETTLQQVLESREENLESLRISINEARRTVEEKKSEMDENRLQSQSKLQEIQHQQQQIKNLETAIQEQQESIQTGKDRLGRLEENTVSAFESLREKENDLQSNHQILTEQKKLVEETRERLEESKTGIVDGLNQLNRYQNQYERIHTLKETTSQRWTAIKKEMADKIASIQAQQKLYEEKQEEKKSNAELKRQLIERINREKESLEGHQKELNTTQLSLNKLNQDLQRFTQQKNLLINMEKNFEGFQRGVKNLLKAVEEKPELSEGFHGVVADLLRVPQGYEVAVETALGQALQFLVTDHDYQAKKLIDFLRKAHQGRVTILPIKTIQPRKLNQHENNILSEFSEATCALDLVSYPTPYEAVFSNLLGRVVIAEHLEAGMQISRRFRQQIKIATMEGELIMPGGSMTGGSNSKQQDGLLVRKREIEEIGHRMHQLQETIADVSGRKDSIEKMVIHSKAQLEDWRVKLDHLEKQEIRIDSSLDSMDTAINELLRTEKRLKSEEMDLEKNHEHLMAEEQKISDEMEKTEEKIESERWEVENDIQTLKTEEKQLEALQARDTDFRVEVAELREKKQSVDREKRELEDQLKQYHLQIQQLQQQEEQAARDRQHASEELDRLTEEQKRLEQQLTEEKETLEKLQQDEENTRQTQRSKAKELETLRKSQEAVRDQHTQMQMKISRQEWQLEQSMEKLDFYQLNSLEEAEEKVQTPPEPSMNTYSLKALKEEMQALGEVHVGSIEEYRRVRERHHFLSAQKQDMEDARDSLQEIIAELEEKMVEQFEKQFKKIQASFQQVFQQLFNGGTAELVLQEPERILYSGVDIVAQPPGKKFQHLSLLSGGEKAMTAISLLFGILLVKPSPFCVLDEIEAALDDSNVGRFADFLVELSRDIQFVVVTHKKQTMERVNSLYGITMEEKGISKLLRLKLADLDESMIAG
ncbi:MAG: chromosome segregation protein SMC [Tindallia sp. MSAO_Bac2]|nr:MAG: chromosome segregation protein SMC [Tindallia sp. MSAO_Bac2]